MTTGIGAGSDGAAGFAVASGGTAVAGGGGVAAWADAVIVAGMGVPGGGTAARTSETDLTASSAAIATMVKGNNRGAGMRSDISARHPQRLEQLALGLATYSRFATIGI